MATSVLLTGSVNLEFVPIKYAFQMEMGKREIFVTTTVTVPTRFATVRMGGTGRTAEIGKISA